jgi:hypothetical protein
MEVSSRRVQFVDWQSAPVPNMVTPDASAKMLALLHASTHPKLASKTLRLRFLKQYLRAMNFNVDMKSFVRTIRAQACVSAQRSSVKDQLEESSGKLRLVWLAGEAVCVRPELVAHWPTPAATAPFYPTREDNSTASLLVGLPNGRTATLTRHQTLSPWAFFNAYRKGIPWRSPAATEARILFQLERAGVPAPRLLAFGQRVKRFFRGESFTLTDLPPDAEPLNQRLQRDFDSPLDRYLFLRNVGRTLRALHDSGARINTVFPAECAILVLNDNQGEIAVVNAPHAVVRCRHISQRDAFADVQHILVGIYRTTTRSERLRLVLGYVDEAGELPKGWRRAVAKLIRG